MPQCQRELYQGRAEAHVAVARSQVLMAQIAAGRAGGRCTSAIRRGAAPADCQRNAGKK
eukprot:CAMPEP_0202048110 /NCGR_PEP_ID=MMETSP0963-20130614/2462_1 /ASSEMBLY_ACC=CAM_ASM_000494 /TAXON_ID=4773 /ORGANISM="Schizochytrium aggregatum, Strain ATCC28209" /LENGTH=58 /DNA_ID=CAMNT_0048612955 /DNA_START=547 /DNA_END=723 /DNA_ORIENTATION=-